MPRRRRIALHVLGYLVVGAVMSLLIPTLRTFARDQPVTYFRALDLRSDLAWLSAQMPDQIIDAMTLKDVDFAWRSDGRRLMSYRLGEQSRSYVFWRHGGDGKPDKTPEGTGNARCVQRGWPMACVEGSEWSAGGANPVRATNAMITFDSGGVRFDIALRPLPLGLLVDAAFWGGFAYALRMLPSLAERLVRRRRGLCVECAYPLRDLARCPECGKQLRCE